MARSVRVLPATCGVSFSATIPQDRPQHCASPEPFRLAADSTIVFLLRNPSLLSLCAAHSAEYYPLATVHFSFCKRPQSFPLRPDPGANCLRQPDARMTRYFRLFSQLTIILGKNASNDRSRYARRPCPALRASYSRLCCNDNVSRLFLSCSGSRLAPVMLSGAYLQRAGVSLSSNQCHQG